MVKVCGEEKLYQRCLMIQWCLRMMAGGFLDEHVGAGELLGGEADELVFALPLLVLIGAESMHCSANYPPGLPFSISQKMLHHKRCKVYYWGWLLVAYPNQYKDKIGREISIIATIKRKKVCEKVPRSHI